MSNMKLDRTRPGNVYFLICTKTHLHCSNLLASNEMAARFRQKKLIRSTCSPGMSVGGSVIRQFPVTCNVGTVGYPAVFIVTSFRIN